MTDGNEVFDLPTREKLIDGARKKIEELGSVRLFLTKVFDLPNHTEDSQSPMPPKDVK